MPRREREGCNFALRRASAVEQGGWAEKKRGGVGGQGWASLAGGDADLQRAARGRWSWASTRVVIFLLAKEGGGGGERPGVKTAGRCGWRGVGIQQGSLCLGFFTRGGREHFEVAYKGCAGHACGAGNVGK